MESPRRRRGRPALEERERRLHPAKTRLNKAERDELTEALAKAGVTEAEILRRLSLEWAAKTNGREPVLAAAS